jgi:hypothetical protein
MLGLALHDHARHRDQIGACVGDLVALEPFPAGVHRVGHVAQGRAVGYEAEANERDGAI